jgi:hypothetical protein
VSRWKLLILLVMLRTIEKGLGDSDVDNKLVTDLLYITLLPQQNHTGKPHIFKARKSLHFVCTIERPLNIGDF